MSIRNTPVIADSDTLDKLKIAEDLCIFFEDQKLKAQNRIRECESFLNNLHLPSKSVKEGLLSLRQNAEDDYSTLLHLERVLNMRDRGDFVPSLDTQIVSPPKIITAFSNKLPEIKRLSPSGDHIGISGGGSHLTKNARISIGSSDNQFTRYIDDDHGEGQGFEMGMKISEEQSLYSDLDENFDPLQYDAKEISDMKSRQNCDNLPTNEKPSNQRKEHEVSDKAIDNEDPRDEEDEEEDDFVPKESTKAFRIGIRQQHKTSTPHNMARSLPVSVPFPEGLPKRGEIFDLPSDDEDEDHFVDDYQGTTRNSRDIERRQSAIPDKIAQIAKSMYDRDGLGFGESPAKY